MPKDDFSDSDRQRLLDRRRGKFNLKKFKQGLQNLCDDPTKREKLFKVFWELLTDAVGGDEVWEWITDYYEQDRSFASIARREKKSSTTVRTRVHRARAILKNLGYDPKPWGGKDKFNRHKKTRIH